MGFIVIDDAPKERVTPPSFVGSIETVPSSVTNEESNMASKETVEVYKNQLLRDIKDSAERLALMLGEDLTHPLTKEVRGLELAKEIIAEKQLDILARDIELELSLGKLDPLALSNARTAYNRLHRLFSA